MKHESCRTVVDLFQASMSIVRKQEVGTSPAMTLKFVNVKSYCVTSAAGAGACSCALSPPDSGLARVRHSKGGLSRIYPTWVRERAALTGQQK
jgi:hypothetical protein